MLITKYPFYSKIKKSTRPVFWREVKPLEVYKMMEICFVIDKEYPRSKSIKDSIKTSWWDEILEKRFSNASKSSENSFKLNYSLFFEHLLLWRDSGRPSKNLVWLHESRDFDEFLEKLKFIILTTGQLLEILDSVIEMQLNEQEKFESKKLWLDKLAQYLSRKTEYGPKSKIVDEMGRYFPGLFNTFMFDILNNKTFNRKFGYDINLIKLNHLITKFEIGDNNG